MVKNLRYKNTSKIFTTGTVFQSKRGGEFKILGQTTNFRVRYRGGRSEKEFCYFLVEFYNGYQTEATASSIKYGAVANPFHPTVHDTGFLGEGKYTCGNGGKITPMYHLWSAMLTRCYSEKYQNRQNTYIGCTVDKRWHNFQTFCEDIQRLEGYESWTKNTKKYAWALDKDIKVKDNKVYSKETCIFTTITKNNKESCNRRWKNNKKEDV